MEVLVELGHLRLLVHTTKTNVHLFIHFHTIKERKQDLKDQEVPVEKLSSKTLMAAEWHQVNMVAQEVVSCG